ncbi:echinoderm microtubule-associated protein-like elp-1 [Anaeramoeba flamelloides]|uniref:Echinoderm microtubule-associated protein-like elp-1 n=1 Tax=Anaeramoeba flamelloides TaxID=1746091 RepID=A0ABQ8Z7Y2_9EUKA|nr:echinoderm microtubule-associated protein-like elp-1 [Anaeramoeba flamelloides]
MSRFFKKKGSKKTKKSKKKNKDTTNSSSSSNETSFSSGRKIPNRDPEPITVHLINARGLESDPSLYCILYLGTQKLKSSLINNSNTQNWDQKFVFNYDWIKPQIRIDFFDINAYPLDRAGFANVDIEMLDLATKLTAYFPLQDLEGEIQISVSIGDIKEPQEEIEKNNSKEEETQEKDQELQNNKQNQDQNENKIEIEKQLQSVEQILQEQQNNNTHEEETSTETKKESSLPPVNTNSLDELLNQVKNDRKPRAQSIGDSVNKNSKILEPNQFDDLLTEKNRRNSKPETKFDINKFLESHTTKRQTYNNSDSITKLLNKTSTLQSKYEPKEGSILNKLKLSSNLNSYPSKLNSSTGSITNTKKNKTEDLLSSTQSLLKTLQMSKSKMVNTDFQKSSFNIDDYLSKTSVPQKTNTNSSFDNSTNKTNSNDLIQSKPKNEIFNSNFTPYNTTNTNNTLNSNNTTTTTDINNTNQNKTSFNIDDYLDNNFLNNTTTTTTTSSSSIMNNKSMNSYNSTTTTTTTTNDRNNFELEFVFGYTGDDRNNVHFTSSGEITYYAAAVGIVYNRQTHKQRFFKFHTDTITCNAIHPNKQIVATGQLNNGTVFIWDTAKCEKISEINPPHEKGVSCLAFSHHQPYLVTVGLDSNHTVCLWNWKTSQLIAKNEGPGNKVLCAHFDPTDGNAFVICGIKHIQFWTIQNDQSLTSYPGTFQGREDSMLLSLAITRDGKILTGNRSGDIYCWGKSDKMVTSKFRAHVGPCVVLKAINSDLFISGGKDGKVNLWSTYSLNKIKQISSIIGGPIRGIDFLKDQVIAGTLKNQIWSASTQTGKSNMEIFSHSEEVHGIACHPFRKEFISTSDDRSVNVWSLDGNKSIGRIPVNGQPRIGAFSPDGRVIGIGLRDGEFKLCSSGSLKQITNRKNATCEIIQMKFSPDSSKLVLCHEDGAIMCYGASTNYRKISGFKLPGIISLDWAKDSSAIRVSTTTRTMCWRVRDSKKIDENFTQWETNDKLLAREIPDIRKCDVRNGIGAKAVENSNKIQIYPYPNTQNTIPIYLSGHGSSVLDVKFLLDSHIISAGGKDHSVFLWKRI